MPVARRFVWIHARTIGQLRQQVNSRRKGAMRERRSSLADRSRSRCASQRIQRQLPPEGPSPCALTKNPARFFRSEKDLLQFQPFGER